MAVVDLGTNTVRLLVAEADARGAWHPVHAEQRVSRLGEGLHVDGALGEGPMARTAATVRDYVDRARHHGAATIRVVATSAVREASNGRPFVARLGAELGVRVDVISGDEEAALTLRGLRRDLVLPAGRMTAFDIGGGSTEYLAARDGVLEAAVSLRLGVVALAERYAFPGRVEARRFDALLDEIRGRLDGELPATIADVEAEVLVGTAGTVTTLAALDLGLTAYDPRRVHGHRLMRRAVDAQLARLAALTVRERGALPCLEPGRADLIVPGIAIVIATLERFGADALVVSDYGLREGIMDSIVASHA